MHHIIYIHSFVIGHLGCFQVLAIVKSAAVNTGVHVSFWVMVFSGYMPSGGIVWSYEYKLQNHCRWWLQAWNENTLTPWSKAMTNLEGILKSQRIDAFELWWWRRLFRVTRTLKRSKRSNQSILKEISPEYSLEGTDAEVRKLQYFGRLMQRTDSF